MTIGVDVSADGVRPAMSRSRVAERVRAFSEAGVDLLLLQCSPQLEEMERFAEGVMAIGAC